MLIQAGAIVPLAIAGGFFLLVATMITGIGTYRIKQLESGEADELERLTAESETDPTAETNSEGETGTTD